MGFVGASVVVVVVLESAILFCLGYGYSAEGNRIVQVRGMRLRLMEWKSPERSFLGCLYAHSSSIPPETEVVCL